MYNPGSTYRIQFNDQFNLKDFQNHLAYLHHFGIGTIYASPILASTPGSSHGYDGIDPQKIDPEIGQLEQLEEIIQTLQKHYIGWLQDIVPNHLAYDTDNPWLFDVLEKGRFSPYYRYFDILDDPIMTPFLGEDAATMLDNHEFSISYKDGRLFLCVYDQKYPLKPDTYVQILAKDQENPVSSLLAKIPAADNLADEWEDWVSRLRATIDENPTNRNYLESCLRIVNSSESELAKILESQEYRLCYWEETHSNINYRRFFTINGLICLNIQYEEVFSAYHQLILELVKKGIFKGLRIDHIDGLLDPTLYLQQLRKATGDSVYIAVEKILEIDEDIPGHWPIQGETGYQFLALVNNLLTRNEAEQSFTDFYSDFSLNNLPVAKRISAGKEKILFERMAGELQNLERIFRQALAKEDDLPGNYDQEAMKESIARFLIHFPVYRFYGNEFPIIEDEKSKLQPIFEELYESYPNLSGSLQIFREKLFTREGSDTFSAAMLTFYQRLMQLTGPLMAKGVEDTLMYRYNRFVGHNEVGDSLEHFGITISDWHQQMIRRQKYHPLAMNTTSTHDTKRGEDVRARLNVLTDIDQLWKEKVREFKELNRSLKSDDWPDQNDEYLIYYTLIGIYPMPGQEDPELEDRLNEYFPKALREAKIYGNWAKPNEPYEEAVCHFATALLDRNKPFWKTFEQLHRKVADFGIINSLVQLILKCTSPGVPDIYQGTEFWDLSLVDPDNRRPVDYQRRNAMLAKIKEFDEATFWEHRYAGQIKLWLTQLLLQLRRQSPDLFLGSYIPLKVEGKHAAHILAFQRKWKDEELTVVVPINYASLCRGDEKNMLAADWGDTRIVIDNKESAAGRDLIHSRNIDISGSILIQDIFHYFPFSILN